MGDRSCLQSQKQIVLQNDLFLVSKLDCRTKNPLAWIAGECQSFPFRRIKASPAGCPAANCHNVVFLDSTGPMLDEPEKSLLSVNQWTIA